MKKENIKAIIRWLETEGCINYMDGEVYQISDGEFEEYYKENKEEHYNFFKNKSEYMSEDEFAVFICRNALEEAGVEEEIIDLCVDWDNQESIDKALEYFKKLERSSL